MHLLMKERELTPFQPQLQSKSIERVFLKNGKNFYKRMRNYSRNRSQKIRDLEQELTERQCTFKPNLSKSSKSIEQLRRLEYKRKLAQMRKNEDKKSMRKSSQFRSQSRSKKSPSKSVKKRKKQTRKELLRQLRTSDASSPDEWEQKSNYKHVNQSNVSFKNERRRSRQEHFNSHSGKKSRSQNQKRKQAYINHSHHHVSGSHLRPTMKGLCKADMVFDELDNTRHEDYSFIQKVSGLREMSRSKVDCL